MLELPSRVEVLLKLHQLGADEISREAISEWAMSFIDVEAPEIVDPAVWETLKALGGADLDGGDRKYLYSDADFAAWADDLRRGTHQ